MLGLGLGLSLGIVLGLVLEFKDCARVRVRVMIKG